MSTLLTLGPPGRLFTVRAPGKGAKPAPDRGAAVQPLPRGTQVDLWPAIRTYSLGWNGLSVAEARLLEALYHGALGPQPYVMYDSQRPNLLPLNWSTGGDAGSADTTGLLAAGTVAGTLGLTTSTVLSVMGGPGAFRWSTPTLAGGQSSTLSLDGQWDTASIRTVPVVPSTLYTAWVSACREATAAAVTAGITLAWLRADGTATGATTTGATAALGTGAASVLSATATSPADAAYAVITTQVLGAAAASVVLLDGWQLQPIAAPATAYLGGGAVRGGITSFDPVYVSALAWDISLTWTETRV